MTLAGFPDDARLWVFAAAEPLAPAQAARLTASAEHHVENWLAHGRPVVGAHELRYGRFLLVAADETAAGVSGCSIDGLFRVLQSAKEELGVRLLDSGLVWFRSDDGEIRSVSRPQFRAMVQTGEVGSDTVVFDNTVATVGDVRAGRWETPLKNSWHARAFRVPVYGEPANAVG